MNSGNSGTRLSYIPTTHANQLYSDATAGVPFKPSLGLSGELPSPHPPPDRPILFHHILIVSTITDSIAMPCNNHTRIVAAKRVPASRGKGKNFGNEPANAFFEKSAAQQDDFGP